MNEPFGLNMCPIWNVSFHVTTSTRKFCKIYYLNYHKNSSVKLDKLSRRILLFFPIKGSKTANKTDGRNNEKI